jgi:peptidyl-dipeptidase Dcp
MFHEFGHALHGLNSNVTYPSLSGTAVSRGLRRVSLTVDGALGYRLPRVLQRFALHYQTGKPIPQALVDRIMRSATFKPGICNSGVFIGSAR